MLDTSAILQGAWSGPGDGCVAPPAVEAELRPGGRDHARWERLRATGLRVEEPDPASRTRVDAAAQRLGETRLSAADRDVAALASTLRDRRVTAEVVTDDYALQNLLTHLGLAWRGTRERGITEARTYALRCSGCGRWWTREPKLVEGDPCPVCGAPVRRKRRR